MQSNLWRSAVAAWRGRPERVTRRWVRRLGSALALGLLTGCSISQYAVRSVADSLAESSEVYAADDDIELVGAATPFGLKTMETLLAQVPDHRGLLLAAARGFTQYAYAFVELPADEIEDHDVKAAYAGRDRARRLYLRARDYGLRGLAVRHRGIAAALKADPARAVAPTSAEDVGLLYWTALAWGAAISLDKDDPRLLADLPAVEALVRRALALDEAFERGAIHTFLISYEMSRASVAADAAARAKRHYARALELAGGVQAAPFVVYAEAACVAQRDRAGFEGSLRRAVAIDAAATPQWRLANLVMQRRARWLLARVDALFPD